MGIEWTPELSTSVTEIDEQHKELFRRINSLLDACGSGQGKGEVGRVIGFLEDYVVTHFGTEERYMAETRYHAAATHKEEHRYFIGQIADLKRKFLEEGSGVHVVLLTIRTAIEWLSSHIRKTDRALGEYLKTRMPAS